MNKFLFVLICMVNVSGFLSAQSVLPTYDQQPMWCIKQASFGMPEPEFKITLRSDTLICGKRYTPVQVNDQHLFSGGTRSYVTAYIRTAGKQVFELSSNCVEALLYDFSLQVGDTIWHKTPDFGIVSTTEIKDYAGGIARKTMTVDYPVRGRFPFPQPPKQRIWVEGIGDIRDPFGFLNCVSPNCEYASNVVCLSANDRIVYGTCNSNCNIITDTKDFDITKTQFWLSPNPMALTNTVALHYKSAETFSGKIFVANPLGQVLFQQSFYLNDVGNITLPWSPATSGMYFLIVENDTGEQQTLPFIAQ